MAAIRIFITTFAIGIVCFLAGFIGPMILAPDANQGPMLGIFITGPLGFVGGFIFAVTREFFRARAE